MYEFTWYSKCDFSFSYFFLLLYRMNENSRNFTGYKCTLTRFTFEQGKECIVIVIYLYGGVWVWQWVTECESDSEWVSVNKAMSDWVWGSQYGTVSLRQWMKHKWLIVSETVSESVWVTQWVIEYEWDSEQLGVNEAIGHRVWVSQ